MEKQDLNARLSEQAKASVTPPNAQEDNSSSFVSTHSSNVSSNIPASSEELQGSDFKKQIEKDLGSFIGQLNNKLKLVTEESVNPSLAPTDSINVLKELIHALRDFKRQIITDLESGRLSLSEARLIQEATSPMLTGIIHNNLRAEDIQRFEQVTQKLRSSPYWRIIIGAIIGTAITFLITALLSLTSVGLSLGLTIGICLGGTMLGGIEGFFSKRKNSIKPVASRARKLYSTIRGKHNEISEIPLASFISEPAERLVASGASEYKEARSEVRALALLALEQAKQPVANNMGELNRIGKDEVNSSTTLTPEQEDFQKIFIEELNFLLAPKPYQKNSLDFGLFSNRLFFPQDKEIKEKLSLILQRAQRESLFKENGLEELKQKIEHIRKMANEIADTGRGLKWLNACIDLLRLIYEFEYPLKNPLQVSVANDTGELNKIGKDEVNSPITLTPEQEDFQKIFIEKLNSLLAPKPHQKNSLDFGLFLNRLFPAQDKEIKEKLSLILQRAQRENLFKKNGLKRLKQEIEHIRKMADQIADTGKGLKWLNACIDLLGLIHEFEYPLKKFLQVNEEERYYPQIKYDVVVTRHSKFPERYELFICFNETTYYILERYYLEFIKREGIPAGAGLSITAAQLKRLLAMLQEDLQISICEATEADVIEFERSNLTNNHQNRRRERREDLSQALIPFQRR